MVSWRTGWLNSRRSARLSIAGSKQLPVRLVRLATVVLAVVIVMIVLRWLLTVVAVVSVVTVAMIPVVREQLPVRHAIIVVMGCLSSAGGIIGGPP